MVRNDLDDHRKKLSMSFLRAWAWKREHRCRLCDLLLTLTASCEGKLMGYVLADLTGAHLQSDHMIG